MSDYIETPSGVKCYTVRMGEGEEAKMKDKVICHYTLWLSNKGERGAKIDSSHDRKEPFACQLGVGLIQGWSDGMIGMKPGGIREIHVPYSQGYGEKGIPGAIPGKTDLIFEIEYLQKGM